MKISKKNKTSEKYFRIFVVFFFIFQFDFVWNLPDDAAPVVV